MLIADRDIRVITPDGELLRQLTLDPTRNYQPTGRHLPAGHPAQNQEHRDPAWVHGVLDVLRDHTG